MKVYFWEQQQQIWNGHIYVCRVSSFYSGKLRTNMWRKPISCQQGLRVWFYLVLSDGQNNMCTSLSSPSRSYHSNAHECAHVHTQEPESAGSLLEMNVFADKTGKPDLCCDLFLFVILFLYTINRWAAVSADGIFRIKRYLALENQFKVTTSTSNRSMFPLLIIPIHVAVKRLFQCALFIGF